jgi:large subunit ribosomal protein L17
MRHRNAGRKLGRTSAHRTALLRNLVTSLLDHERIETTDAKAKELRRIADRMITLGKRGDLHARRQALRVVQSRDVTSKLFSTLADRYRERPGGYTRVLKLRTRVGDAAPISMVELVDREMSAKATASDEKPAKTAAKKARAEKPAKAAKPAKPAKAAKTTKGAAAGPKTTAKGRKKAPGA